MPCLNKEKTVFTDIPFPTIVQAMTKIFWEKETEQTWNWKKLNT